MSTVVEFLVTKEYRRFEEFCHACHRDRYIGLCYGPPGVGKTLSARQYARWDVLEPYLDAWSNAERVRQGPYGQLAACHTVLYTPTVTATARSLEREIAGLVMQMNCVVDHARAAQATPDSTGEREPCTLLIVDEADRLKMQGLEQLRDFYDRGAVGLVLIGMPGLEKRLARYPQLYSRVGFAHAFRPLSEEEMAFILRHHWAALGRQLDPTQFTDQEAVAAIIRITAGNFRLLNRLVAQIRRITALNSLQTITREVVEVARECLVIGTT
jgi:DNA transposition AAA+ family ATPase